MKVRNNLAGINLAGINRFGIYFNAVKHTIFVLGVAVTLLACSQQTVKLPNHPKIDAAATLWQNLLADDPQNPDAHYQLADYFAKRYNTGGNKEDKQLAIYHGQQVFLTKPNDLTTQTLLYGIYYSAVRKGEEGDKKALNALFLTIPLQVRRNFYPPSLALYLQQIDKVPKDKTKERQLLLNALREQPQNALIHLQLSRYFYELKSLDLAVATLHQAQHLEPDNPDVLLALGDAYKSRAYGYECLYDHLADIKQSANFYKLALSKKADLTDAHFGLMVDYAHLGLAPLSVREGEIWLSQDPAPANKWSLAIFAGYQGENAKASDLFAAALTAAKNTPDIKMPVNRGYIDYLMIQAKWAEAAKAFPAYVQGLKQPGVTDLISAAIIRAELDDENVKLDDLWRTDKKAVLFSKWDEALARYWRSEISEEQFKAAADNSCRLADYEFYAGYFKMLHNKVGEAKVHFERAKHYPQPMSLERKLAEVFLHNL